MAFLWTLARGSGTIRCRASPETRARGRFAIVAESGYGGDDTRDRKEREEREERKERRRVKEREER